MSFASPFLQSTPSPPSFPSGRYGVPYPNAYADKSNKDADRFNCYQRAHQNAIENYPQFLFLLAAGSVQAGSPHAREEGGTFPFPLNHTPFSPLCRAHLIPPSLPLPPPPPIPLAHPLRTAPADRGGRGRRLPGGPRCVRAWLLHGRSRRVLHPSSTPNRVARTPRCLGALWLF